MEIHVLLVTIFICQTSAALRFQVTQEDCDRSIDLSKENRVIIDYADSDFNVMIGVCIMYVTTSSPDEMICITSDSRTCTQSFSYHIGRYNPFGKKYSCDDFNRKHLCKPTRRVALAYSDNFLHPAASISVTLFLKKYKPTTTRRPDSNWSSWSPSSWSSWTSRYDDDDDQKTKKGSGAIIAIIFAAIGVVVLLIVVKCSKKPKANNQTDTSPPVRYSPESEHIDDSVRPAGANDNKTHSSGSKPVQDPPTYEEYEKYKPVYEPDTNNEQPVPPDTENLTIPSAPPPPYPGY